MQEQGGVEYLDRSRSISEHFLERGSSKNCMRDRPEPQQRQIKQDPVVGTVHHECLVLPIDGKVDILAICRQQAAKVLPQQKCRGLVNVGNAMEGT